MKKKQTSRRFTREQTLGADPDDRIDTDESRNYSIYSRNDRFGSIN